MIPIGARRTLRFGLVLALTLAGAYGSGMPLAFLAPVFAVLLTATPMAPPGLKGLLGLTVIVLVTTGAGLLLIPFMNDYPVTAVLIITLGVYGGTVVSIGRGKALVGALLTIGFTLVPAAGLIDYAIASAAVDALVFGIALAVLSQWIVYPFLPETAATGMSVPTPPAVNDVHWIALRTTLIVLLPLLATFSNPSLYLPTIMKTVLLAQQGSRMSAREAGHELIGSTLLAGALAMAFWFVLKIWPVLWMFVLWMLLLGLCIGAKLYGVSKTRYAPSFWTNAVVTMLIMLGPAVQDSAAGADVYQGFATRFSLFVVVTLYAWGAIAVLERLRTIVRSREALAPSTQ